MSKLGTPDRKLWFEHHVEMEPDYSNSLKFTYGHIIEQLVLLLLKEAGHTVTEEQAEVEIDGIKGHKDCRVDGVNIDIKSASSFAFKKFATGELFRNDPFGYVHQLSSYSYPEPAAFVAVNKENGEIAVLPLEAIDMVPPKARIKRVKEVVAMTEPPVEKCYPEEPVGKGGNMGLSKNCGYCPFKERCWTNLRKFQYASGTVYLTKVVETPRVSEIT